MDNFVKSFKEIVDADFSLKILESSATDEERIEEIIEELEAMEVWK